MLTDSNPFYKDTLPPLRQAIGIAWIKPLECSPYYDARSHIKPFTDHTMLIKPFSYLDDKSHLFTQKENIEPLPSLNFPHLLKNKTAMLPSLSDKHIFN
jgi:hypothetical protein